MKTLTRLLALMCLLATNINLFGTEYYVSVNGSDANLVGTCQTPWQTIQHALNYPGLLSGDVIKVLNDGVYTENIIWPSIDGITLTGWQVTGSNCIGISDYVTINGSSSGSVITISPATVISNLTVIEYFILTNGYNTDGAGLYLSGYVAPSLSHLVIERNTASNNGGGVYYNLVRDYVFDANNNCFFWKILNPCIFDACEINENRSLEGGGLYIKSSKQTTQPYCPEIDCSVETALLTHCNTKDNHATNSGGGMFILNAFINCINVNMSGNEAINNDGGAIYCSESKTKISTMLLAQNSCGGNGGAINLGIGLSHYTGGCLECSIIPSNMPDHEWADLRMIQNTASGDGGGLNIKYPTDPPMPEEKYVKLIYENGEISLNNASNNGGGISCYNYSQMSLKDIRISENNANSLGGAIYNNCGENLLTSTPWTLIHYFEQLIIDHNTAANHAGIFTKQTFYCLNSTIADNFSFSQYGSGLGCYNFSISGNPQNVNPIFFNTVLYDNYYNSIISSVYLNNSNCIPYFQNCLVHNYVTIGYPTYGFYLNGFGTYNASTWNSSIPTIYDSPPLFSSNYDISNNSPCYNVGSNVLQTCDNFPSFTQGMYLPWNYNPTPTWQYDFQGGGPRIYNLNIIDIGAHEAPFTKSIANSNTSTSEAEDYKITISPNPICQNSLIRIQIEGPKFNEILLNITDVAGRVIINNLYRKTCSNDLIISLKDYKFAGSMLNFILKITSIDNNSHYLTKKVITN